MRVGLAALAALLGACSASAPPAMQPAQIPELIGRVAGTPRSCISFRPNENLRITEADRHTLIYGSGRTVWVNHLGSSCGFGSEDVPVFDASTSSLCRGDIVRSFDRLSRIAGPSCVLGDFIPYTR